MTIIVCQGSGSGLMNTLLTQLNQIMCSRDYTIERKFTTMCKKAFVSQNGWIPILRPVSDTQRSKYYDFVV